MTANLIDGKLLASEVKNKIKQKIKQDMILGIRPPGLAVILVGDDPASQIYVRNKREACQQVGIHSFYHPFPKTTHEVELIELIDRLNQDPLIDGILLQTPLPPHLNTNTILERIDPNKDVDGFHPYNMGRLVERNPALRPCTPFGIMKILEHIKQKFKGKHAVIVGASNIVGRPMALEFLIAGATVTVCHRFTHDLPSFVNQADILVAAVGKPELIKGEWIKPGATAIDVGFTRLPDGKLIGDIEFDVAKERAAWITPVPGGVGPMTVAMLIQNTLIASKLQQSKS